MQKGVLWPDATLSHFSGVPLPDDDAVLSEEDNAGTATITLRGRDHRLVASIAQINRPVGHGSMVDAVADARHVAFIYSLSDDEQAQNHWDLYLWDRRSGTLTVVSHNPTNAKGDPLPGGWVHPVLTNSALFWIEAADNAVGRAIGAAGSALMRYDFGTDATTTVTSGLVTALVAYRGRILVTAVPSGPLTAPSQNSPNPAQVVRAFDEITGAESPAPAGITAGPEQPDWFSTDGDLLVWNTSAGKVRAWRPSWGASIDLLPDFGTWHAGTKLNPPVGYPGYPRIVGHFLAWLSGQTYVLDLHTNSFVRLTSNNGGLEASGTRLEFLQYVHSTKPAIGQGLEFTQWVLDMATLPDLPRCP